MDKVKVGGLAYKVELIDDLEGESGEIGHIMYKKAKIGLDSNLEEQIHNQTFVHELTHAILMESGFSEHSEDMANRIGLVLYQVLKDNDFSFIQDKETVTVYTCDEKVEHWDK